MGAKPGGTKGNRQEAKYQKPERKHGKPGGGEGGRRGSREAEPGTGETAGEARPGRRERKNSGLSSQNRNRGGRKKPEGKGKGRRRKRKASTCGTAVGAKQGRTKGNKQEAEYRNRDRMHGKPGRTERGRPKERKRERSTAEATVRRRQEERERKKQRLSSEMLKRKRTKGSGSQAPAPEKRIERGSPVERLRERSREGRKETNRKPSTGTGEEGMGNQAGKNGESKEAKAERRHG